MDSFIIYETYVLTRVYLSTTFLSLIYADSDYCLVWEKVGLWHLFRHRYSASYVFSVISIRIISKINFDSSDLYLFILILLLDGYNGFKTNKIGIEISFPKEPWLGNSVIFNDKYWYSG